MIERNWVEDWRTDVCGDTKLLKDMIEKEPWECSSLGEIYKQIEQLSV